MNIYDNTKPRPFEIKDVRNDFPIFNKKINGKDLIFLDSAASAQKPKQVIDLISEYYLYHYANVHRGVYSLSENLNIDYEKSR
jgi:cysteine desulfurase/selenocysteine lyase